MTTTDTSKATADTELTQLLAMVKALSDSQLEKLLAAAKQEKAAREQQRKDEAIAKIRALAGDAGIVVSIAGARSKRATAKRARRTKQAA